MNTKNIISNADYKRKRVPKLKKGESLRKDGVYQYRYTDIRGKRHSIYSKDLVRLRVKEDEIKKSMAEGVDYAAGQITVLELVKRYVNLKQGVRYNTKVGYNFVINLLKNEDFSLRKINTIKISDAQQWMLKLNREGKRYNTITSVRGVLKPAFRMAVSEDILRKNPFDFPLVELIGNDTVSHPALTQEELERYMAFVKDDPTYCKYYDLLVVFLETGIRVSELCGLVMENIDFENRRIKIDHQLLRGSNGVYHIEMPKTKSGIRFIPMSDNVYVSLEKIIESRPKPEIEPVVDNYTGFLLLDKKLQPKVALHITNYIRNSLKKYYSNHDDTLPHITPHAFRHTFCTNMANAGMDIKSLQYIMGHSDIGTTLGIYTHSTYNTAAASMKKAMGVKTDGK